MESKKKIVYIPIFILQGGVYLLVNIITCFQSMVYKHQVISSKLKPTVNPKSLIDFVSVAFLIAALEFGVIKQAKQGFYCDDPSISFPYRGDTISLTTLLVVSLFGPFLIIALVEALEHNSFNEIQWRTVFRWYKTYVIVLCLNLLVTQVAKVVFGEHRPHFLKTCVPDAKCESGSFVDEYTCTNDNFGNYFLLDSSRSFPSGHAALSVFTSLYCSVSISRGIFILIRCAMIFFIAGIVNLNFNQNAFELFANLGYLIHPCVGHVLCMFC